MATTQNFRYPENVISIQLYACLQAAKESLASWRKGLFVSYEKQLKKTPPECLAGRLLYQ